MLKLKEFDYYQSLMSILLSSLRAKQTARVTGISPKACSYIKKKLLSLGFCNNHRLTVIRKAPLGCPIEVEILDNRIMLRQSEAQCLLVEDTQ